MTIEIHDPEAEAIIRRRMKAGGFNSAEDVIVHALKTALPAEPLTTLTPRLAGRKSLAQLFAESPFKGLDIDFEREPDYGRDVTR